jgi:hypothetical protein
LEGDEVQPGADFMITIFWDFCQFSANKLAQNYSKINVLIIFFKN